MGGGALPLSPLRTPMNINAYRTLFHRSINTTPRARSEMAEGECLQNNNGKSSVLMGDGISPLRINNGQSKCDHTE